MVSWIKCHHKQRYHWLRWLVEEIPHQYLSTSTVTRIAGNRRLTLRGEPYLCPITSKWGTRVLSSCNTITMLVCGHPTNCVHRSAQPNKPLSNTFNVVLVVPLNRPFNRRSTKHWKSLRSWIWSERVAKSRKAMQRCRNIIDECFAHYRYCSQCWQWLTLWLNFAFDDI